MMPFIEEKLERLGLALPDAAGPMGSYAPAVVVGGLVYLSGQLPREGDRVAVVGTLGGSLTLEEGRCAARLALLRGLAVLKSQLGSLERIDRVVKLNVYVRSNVGFGEQSAVADAASELLEQLFGVQKLPARTAIGVLQLPKNAAVELDLVASLVSAGAPTA